jgi:hypothetical protein
MMLDPDPRFPEDEWFWSDEPGRPARVWPYAVIAGIALAVLYLVMRGRL